MSEMEAEALAENAVLLGLIDRHVAQDARLQAEDGSFEALANVLLRRQLLTSWQLAKLRKRDHGGLFYGEYKVLFHLAEGTFARVYRGIHSRTGQSVAIKVLRNRFAQDTESVDRFNREADSGRQLVHPNIVQIYDFGAQDNRHYMVMEYVEGSNLREFLKFRNKLTGAEARPVMLGLCRGLSHALSAGLTHRDIKGTNILISNSRVPKLVDFGLATIRDEGDSKKLEAAHGVRTVDYAALERTCGSPKGDPRSDIFFLGCVFYQMLAGQLPMPEAESKDPLAKMLKRSFGAIKPLNEHPEVSDLELIPIVDKMMQISLDKRYDHIDKVVADLETLEKHVDPESTQAVQHDELDISLYDSMKMPTIMCLESDESSREAMRKSFPDLGFRTLVIGDAEHALQRFREVAPEILLYDADGLDEQEPLKIYGEMIQRAIVDGHDFGAIILLGPKQQSLAEQLPAGASRTVVLNKPLKMREIKDAIDQLRPSVT